LLEGVKHPIQAGTTVVLHGASYFSDHAGQGIPALEAVFRMLLPTVEGSRTCQSSFSFHTDWKRPLAFKKVAYIRQALK
jgi:hypothetical protein